MQCCSSLHSLCTTACKALCQCFQKAGFQRQLWMQQLPERCAEAVHTRLPRSLHHWSLVAIGNLRWNLIIYSAEPDVMPACRLHVCDFDMHTRCCIMACLLDASDMCLPQSVTTCVPVDLDGLWCSVHSPILACQCWF